MSQFQFSLKPLTVSKVKTKFRTIQTKLPVPASIPLLNKLFKYEARSMHGQMPIVWDRAADFNVYDKYGNKWLDFSSTIFVTNSGHGNPQIIAALKKVLAKPLLHTYTYANQNRIDFLEKLVQITPPYLQKAFLVSAGTEATEVAIKLMRLYGQSKKPAKVGIVSFYGNMHGRTMGAEMLKGNPESAKWIAYRDPHIYYLPFPYPWSVSEPGQPDWGKQCQDDLNALQKTGVRLENLCGIIIESYQGWAGVLYPKKYIETLATIAKKYNIIITCDEIQSGFGRTGKLFTYQHYGIKPQLVCFGKGVSSSLPLAGIIGNRELIDLPGIGSMSSTHSGNPLCTAAGYANLQALEKYKLVQESARKGKVLHQILGQLQKKYSNYIKHICGQGLLAGIILEKLSKKIAGELIASRICERAMQKGLLLVHTGRESIKIGPPLTIKDDALLEGLKVLDESFSEVINEL